MLYRYLGAGHYVNGLIPYEPSSPGAVGLNGLGDTALANTNTDADADARLWPEVLSFLANPAGQTGTITAPATPPTLNSPSAELPALQGQRLRAASARAAASSRSSPPLAL